MNAMVKAELLKLRTTRMAWISALLSLCFVPVSVALAIMNAGAHDTVTPSLHTAEGIRNVFAAASSGSILVLLIGILVVASEFRYNTATSTFLVSPCRKQVIRAKLIATALVGAGIGLVASVLTLVTALPWLSERNIDVTLLSRNVGVVLIGGIAATVIYGLVGVGIGSLIRNQTTAVIVALVWVMIVEGLLVSFLPEVGRWMPGGAAATLSGAATASGHLLPMWAGALVFLAYGLGFAAIGTRYVIRRDVT